MVFIWPPRSQSLWGDAIWIVCVHSTTSFEKIMLHYILLLWDSRLKMPQPESKMPLPCQWSNYPGCRIFSRYDVRHSSPCRRYFFKVRMWTGKHIGLLFLSKLLILWRKEHSLKLYITYNFSLGLELLKLNFPKYINLQSVDPDPIMRLRKTLAFLYWLKIRTLVSRLCSS